MLAFSISSLTGHVSRSYWTYPFLLAIAAVDAFFPIVPSETSVILGGTLAGQKGLSIVLVIAFAAVGAILGDNITYWFGRKAENWVIRHLLRGKRSRLDWAEHQIDERGGSLIVTARFIPGGRTLTMVTCGVTEYPWRRFILFTTIAGIIWACYAGLLGYIAGTQFEHDKWKGFAIAFAIAISVSGVIELIRYLRKRTGGDAPAVPE